ncbi:MAG: RNA chaperone Hfq [Clostridiales bacterium]|nr:RNA chaperone Hfq [Clostridiales bacterium]
MADNNNKSIQDRFLSAAKKTECPVSIFVTNGFHINKAKIIGFDSYAVIAEADGKQMLIYKHAISTITPEKDLAVLKEEK